MRSDSKWSHVEMHVNTRSELGLSIFEPVGIYHSYDQVDSFVRGLSSIFPTRLFYEFHVPVWVSVSGNIKGHRSLLSNFAVSHHSTSVDISSRLFPPVYLADVTSPITNPLPFTSTAIENVCPGSFSISRRSQGKVRVGGQSYISNAPSVSWIFTTETRYHVN